MGIIEAGGKINDGRPGFRVIDFTGKGSTRSTRPYQDATYPFLKKHFGISKLRWVVSAFRVWQGEPRDRGLEQHFAGDAEGLRSAKQYARKLVEEKAAVSASVELEAELPAFFYKYDRNIGGWNVVVREVYEAEAPR